MAFEKISVSMDAGVLARARHAAEREGKTLSAWLSDAADRAARLIEAKEAVEDYLHVFGEPDPTGMDEFRQELASAGYYRPNTAEEEKARLAALTLLRSFDPDAPYDAETVQARMRRSG